MFDPDTSTDDPRDLRGGHHDAGDFDIRPYHVVVAQYLMRAFEIRPERFSDNQLTLPESGNIALQFGTGLFQSFGQKLALQLVFYRRGM